MDVLSRLLHLAAIACSLLIIAGWGLFAVDETSAASQHTQQEIAGEAATRSPDPDPDQEAAREQAHGKVRETIDDANDVLLRPFAALGDTSGNKWVRRSVPALLSLVVFGFGLAFLARFVAGRW
jgi:hypothetical protein